MGICGQSNDFTARALLPKSYENHIVKNQLFMFLPLLVWRPGLNSSQDWREVSQEIFLKNQKLTKLQKGDIYLLWFVTTIVVSSPTKHQYCTFVSCFVSCFVCSLSNENSDSKIQMHLLKYMCVCAGTMPKSPTCDRPMLELIMELMCDRALQMSVY